MKMRDRVRDRTGWQSSPPTHWSDRCTQKNVFRSWPVEASPAIRRPSSQNNKQAETSNDGGDHRSDEDPNSARQRSTSTRIFLRPDNKRRERTTKVGRAFNVAAGSSHARLVDGHHATAQAICSPLPRKACLFGATSVPSASSQKSNEASLRRTRPPIPCRTPRNGCTVPSPHDQDARRPLCALVRLVSEIPQQAALFCKLNGENNV
jgi:hypothetical protein